MYSWPLMRETVTPLDRAKMIKFIATTKRFTNGENVKNFEDKWSCWLGSKKSLFVSSGSTANFLLLAAVIEKYNLKRGDKVLVPACTWMTNVAPIMQLGLEPIFCDINLKDFSFDVESLSVISKYYPNIKVIFVTHLLGFAADNDAYKKFFPDAIIINDVCESHGARFNDGSRVGSESIGATFSFYFGHHMTTIEGGMVSTNDEDLYDIMKMKRSHGLARESEHFNEYANKYSEIDKTFLFITDGYNFRNHEICAVLGISQLKKLDKSISIRRNNYSQYLELMNKHFEKFYVPGENKGNSSFCFPLISKNKNTHLNLKQLLIKNGIEYRPIVSGNLLSQPFLKDYSITGTDKNVNILEKQGVYVGNNQYVSKKDIAKLEEILNAC